MTIRRTLAAALAASAIAAPAATAMPAPPDMQASRAQAAQAQQGQDLRGEHAQDAALHPRKSQAVDAPGATAADSQSKSTPVAPGQPTWAVNPKPLPPPTAQAATQGDDGVDWTTIGLGIGISLLVIGGIAALTSRSKRLPRTRVST
jgi:hypothetical protein